MMTRKQLWMAVLVAACVSTTITHGAQAQAPAAIPIQGVLTDDAGTPVDGDKSVLFALYDADVGGSPLYTETQTVTVSAGLFSIYLGDISPLDLSLFRDHELWLAVTIDGGVELSPRVQFATAPYAAYAAHAGDATTVGGVGAAGLARSTVGAGLSVNMSNEISIDRTQFDTWVTENIGGEAPDNSMNHARYTDTEATTAVSAADTYVRNTGDTITGPTTVSSTLTVTGVIDAQGGINAGCGTGYQKVGPYCMTIFRRFPPGGTTDNMAYAISDCADEGARVCPLDAFLACQALGASGGLSSGAACVADTTPPASISTSPGVLTGEFGNSGSTSLTQRSVVYHSGVDPSGSGAGPMVTDIARIEDARSQRLRYYCCQ